MQISRTKIFFILVLVISLLLIITVIVFYNDRIRGLENTPAPVNQIH